MAYDKEIKKGITSFGYVTNIRTFSQEANDLLSQDEVPFKSFEFNIIIDETVEKNKVIYKNKFGKPATNENALYALFKTDKKTSNGDELIAYYERQRVEKNWTGIYFTTEKEFENLYDRAINSSEHGSLIIDLTGSKKRFYNNLEKELII